MKTYKKQNSFVEVRSPFQTVDVMDRVIDALDRGESEGIIPDRLSLLADVRDQVGRWTRGECADFELQASEVAEIQRVEDRDLLRYLIYRYRYQVNPTRRILDDFPPCLQIEPTSICNYRCVFCYQTDVQFTKKANGFMGSMGLAMFKDLIDQAEGRCEAVTLASRGEPLICPEICDMLRYCEGKFLGLKMNTNAWFLDEEKAHAILESGLNTLVFSADAASEPLYSTLRVGGKLDRVVENIKLFRDIREKHYPDQQIETRVSGVKFDSEQELDDMESFWGDLCDAVAFVEYNPWENTYEREVNDLTDHCSDLWRRMFVWYDGCVNPCDVDYRSDLQVGNAADTSLTDLWQSAAYQSYRSAHETGKRCDLEPCKRCTVV